MTKNNKKGFTIIEVVLVLAIAGLIFLMVFIALPALQRSQRNTQREDDLARVITSVNNYQTNNSGKVPFGRDGGQIVNLVTRYMDDGCAGTASGNLATFTGCGNEFTDPQGAIYWMRDGGDGAPTVSGEGANQTSTSKTPDFETNVPTEHGFVGFSNASCGDEGVVAEGSGSRDVAVFMNLEGGAIACNDNH